MDIFTTALTKVRLTPIKPEKLRVKSLKKEAATKELSDDIDHLEDHDLYFVEEKNKEKNKKNQQSASHDSSDEEPVILHKQDILHPKTHDHDDKVDDDKHLDIFV